MASYTSRILVIAVPSIVGILSILFFNRKRKSNSIKSTDTISLPTEIQYSNSMKLKHNQSCCTEDSAEMQLKEDKAPSESTSSSASKITKSYANCLKQIRTREVLITANGVQDVENSDVEDISVSTGVSRVAIANGSTKIKVSSIKKVESHVIEKQIAEFSYYDTGARPKVKKDSFQNGSSLSQKRENGVADESRQNLASCSSSKMNGKSEKPLQENGERKNKAFSTNNVNKNESTQHLNSNGVSHSTLKSKRNKSNLYENNNRCQVSTISCERDKSQSSINKLSVGVHAVKLSYAAVSKPEKIVQTIKSKNMDTAESVGVHSNSCEQVRTANNEQVDENIKLSVNNSLTTDNLLIKNAEDTKENGTELAYGGAQCISPESGRSSSSSEITENTKVDKDTELPQDLTASNLPLEPMNGNPESAYCESINYESLRLESYEVLFGDSLIYFQVPRFCASFLKNVPCVSRWSCPNFPEGSNDSGKGGSEIHFGCENPSSSMVYEFDFPTANCGVLIGKKGSFINHLKFKSNASIWIRNYPFDRTKKIVTLAGEESDINVCLGLIRDKFPLIRYPDITLEPTGYDSAKVIIPPSLKLSLPEGVEFQVVLSATVNACNFFVQLPTHPSYHALTPFTMSMTSMYSHCDSPTVSNPSVGNIVAAPVSDGWFRAEIVEVNEDETCKLKYLDYGGYQMVPCSELRQINVEYMQMPFQATECYLADVSCFEEIGFTAESKALFEELAQGQILSAFVAGVAENGVPCLHLYQVNGATNTFINQALVEAGLLQWDTYGQEVAS